MILISLDIDGVLLLCGDYELLKEIAALKKQYESLPLDQQPSYSQFCDMAAVNLFNKNSVRYLNDLISAIEATGETVGILLHSAWRTKSDSIDHFRSLFKQYKFSSKLIGKTEDSLDKKDGINQWLDKNKETYNIKDYIVIEDEDINISDEHIVLCRDRKCFSKTHFEQAINLLKRTIPIKYTETQDISGADQLTFKESKSNSDLMKTLRDMKFNPSDPANVIPDLPRLVIPVITSTSSGTSLSHISSVDERPYSLIGDPIFDSYFLGSMAASNPAVVILTLATSILIDNLLTNACESGTPRATKERFIELSVSYALSKIAQTHFASKTEKRYSLFLDKKIGLASQAEETISSQIETNCDPGPNLHI